MTVIRHYLSCLVLCCAGDRKPEVVSTEAALSVEPLQLRFPICLLWKAGPPGALWAPVRLACTSIGLSCTHMHTD